MELRFTWHARQAMDRRRIDQAVVEAVIDRARSVEIGPTAIIYDGDVEGRLIRVVIARGSSPAFVITVHERDR